MGEEKGDDEDDEVEDADERTHGLAQVTSSHVVLWHVLIQQEERKTLTQCFQNCILIFCKYYLTSGTQLQQEKRMHRIIFLFASYSFLVSHYRSSYTVIK